MIDIDLPAGVEFERPAGGELAVTEAADLLSNARFPGNHPLFAGPLCYGIDYWPKDAKIIQVDINPDRIGLTKPVSVGIVGDSRKAAALSSS